ncbi:MAG TPA: hypothetical protein DEA55_05850 [Rhodospirillaceae bacterium]|nr:hypothetical protein [Rhodospirillaceae bacterium]
MFLSLNEHLSFGRPVTSTRFGINSATIEKKVQLAVLAFDVLALILSYYFSLSVTASIVDFFNAYPLEELYAQADSRKILFLGQGLALLFLFFANGQYTKRIPWWSQVRTITKVTAYSFLAEGFINFALDMEYSRILIITNWVFAFGMLIVTRLVANGVKSRSKAWKIPTTIIGDADVVTDTLFALNADPGMGLSPASVLIRDKNPDRYDRNDFPDSCKKVPVLDGNHGCEDYIRENPGNFYIISIDSFRGHRRDHLVDFLNRNKIQYALIQNISRASICQSEPLHFFGNDVVLLRNKSSFASPLSLVLKEGMDFFGAVVALTLFAIPMTAVAVMMKLEGHKGDIFFRGMRVGKNGKLFRCWKFQTMEPNSDRLLEDYLAKNPAAKAHWDKYQKLDDDPRVKTRIARFIRKASIDELPQLLNVLKGEMSLIGPRPILENQIADYGANIDKYTSVKPGITGLWQVSGRNDVSFQRRVSWDAWYVNNWSLWGDIVIILKTLKVVLSRSGAS